MNSRFKVLIGIIAIFALIATVGAIYTYGGKTWQENDVLIIPKDELKSYEQTGLTPEAEIGDEPSEAEPGEEAFQPQLILPPTAQAEFAFPIELTRNVYFNPSGKFGGYFGAKRIDKITHLPRLHDGIDMTSVIADAKLYAAYDGEIIDARFAADCGNMIVIKVNNPKVTWFKYCHLSKIASGVTQGNFESAKFNGKRQIVKKGDLVGYQGNTGAHDLHIHFAAYKGGTWASRNAGATPVNPVLLYPNVKWPTSKRGLVTEIAPGGVLSGAGGTVYKYGDTKDRFDDLILKCAAQYGILPNLIKAFISAESSFDPNAVSDANYKGLMQISLRTSAADVNTARQASGAGNLVTPSNIFNPEINMCAGTQYLKMLFHGNYRGGTKGNAKLTVGGYNQGPGNPNGGINNGYYGRVNGFFKTFENRDIASEDFSYTPIAVAVPVVRPVYGYDVARARADGLQTDVASLTKYNSLDNYIVKCAVVYQIDPNFIKAVIRQESVFDANTVNPSTSGTGFMGVTQNGIDQLNINRETTKITNGPHITKESLKELEAGVCAGTEVLWYWYHKTDEGKAGVKKVVQKYSNNANEDNPYWTAVSTRYKLFTGADLTDAVFNYAPATTTTPPQGTTTVTAITNKKIILFGDSITGIANYESQVKSLCPGFTVVTKKRDGRFIREMISDFDTEVKNENPGVVVVLGGANDFGEPTIAPQTILDRLNQVYAKAKASNIKVAAISVTPFKGYSKSPWNTEAQSAKVPQLNALIKSEVGSNVDFYVDAYSEFDDGSGKLKAQYAGATPDGLHPRGGGSKLGELVAAVIPGCTGGPAISTPSSGLSKVSSTSSADFYTYTSACSSSVEPKTSRVEGLIVPKGASATNVDFYFHGLNPPGLRSGQPGFAAQYMQTYFAGEVMKEPTVVLTGSSNHIHNGDANEWLKARGEFKCFYDEAMVKLQSVSVNPSTMTLVGHSNGGGTIYNVFNSGFLSEPHLPLTNVVSLDGCYPDWCVVIADKLPASTSMIVYYKPDGTSGTKTSSEKINGKPRVTLKQTALTHDDIPKKCLFSYLTNGECTAASGVS